MQKYKNLNDLSDSEEEIHPNIDTKSYRKFIKEQRIKRLEELQSKNNLTEDEEKELKELEYKALPVVKEVPEDNFRVSKEESIEDYSNDLEYLVNNCSVEFFIERIEKNNINLKTLEELIDLNLIEYIKDNCDEVGLLLMKLSLNCKWLREFGKNGLFKISKDKEKLDLIIKTQYEAAKDAIQNLSDEQ